MPNYSNPWEVVAQRCADWSLFTFPGFERGKVDFPTKCLKFFHSAPMPPKMLVLGALTVRYTHTHNYSEKCRRNLQIFETKEMCVYLYSVSFFNSLLQLTKSSSHDGRDESLNLSCYSHSHSRNRGVSATSIWSGTPLAPDYNNFVDWDLVYFFSFFKL